MLWLLLIHEEEWNNHSSSWMSNIQCISLPHLIYAVICGWTCRLFPCLFQGFFLKFLKFLMSSVVQLLSRVWLFVTTRTAACQAPLSIGFPGKNTGVGWYFLLQGIFLGQGSNLRILHWQVDFFFYHWAIREAHMSHHFSFNSNSVLYDRLFRHYHLGQQLSNLLEGVVFKGSIWWNSHIYWRERTELWSHWRQKCRAHPCPSLSSEAFLKTLKGALNPIWKPFTIPLNTH